MGSSFFITWAWPFPLLVVLTCKLFIKDKLRFRQLFICFIVPLLSMISSFTSNERKQLSLSNLCVNQTTEGQHYWEKCLRTPTGKNWWIIRMRGLWNTKVISESYFAAVSLYLINPIVRTAAMRRIILFVIVTYLSLRPFTKGIYIVLWIEVTPVLSFSLALVNSMFQSFLYVYDINKETSVPFFIATFQYLGAIIYSSLNSMLFWDR